MFDAVQFTDFHASLNSQFHICQTSFKCMTAPYSYVQKAAML